MALPRVMETTHGSLMFMVLLLGSIICRAMPVYQSNSEDLRALSIEDLMKLPVQSVSKFTQTLENAPASVIIITHDQIVERGYFDLIDVLKDLPGIDLVDHARGFGEFYTLRGIEGNDRFLVFVDNQKINPTSGTFLSIGNSIPIRFAERIEIVLNPASALYGADAFSGIIHIYNSDPGDTGVSAYVSTGNDDGRDISMAWGYETHEIRFRIQVRLFQSDGPDFLDEDSAFDSIHSYIPPLRNEFEQPVDDHSISFKASFRDWSFSYFRQGFDEGNAFGQHPRSNIYNRENKWALSTDILTAGYHRELGGSGTFDARLSWNKHVQDPDTQFFKTLAPYEYDKLYHQYMTGEDTSWRAEAHYFNEVNSHIQFLVGVELERIESIPPYANDQVLGSSVKFEGDAADLIRRDLTIRDRRNAVFSQFEIKPSSSITLAIGGRFDTSNRHSSSFNPRAGVIFKPGKNTNIKVFYGTAFQAPSLFYQYEQWGSVNAVMLSVDELQETYPGWKLDNQELESMEVSVSHTIVPHCYFQFSAYQNQLKDVIERVVYTDHAYNKYFSTPDQPMYSLGFRNENTGTQKVKGMDCSFTLYLTDNLESYAWYSYTDAQVEQGDVESPTPRVAKNKAAIHLTARNLFGFLGCSMRFKWVGPINNRNKAFFPSGHQPGYHETSLFLTTTTPFHGSHAFIHIQNLFDRHIEHGGLFDQVIYLPTVHQPGISVFLGFEYAP